MKTNTMAPSSDGATIRQTIRALRAAGYVLDHVNDGEERVPVTTEQAAIDAITAVDEAALHVTHPTERGSHVFFVLGNSDPCDTVCDYGVSLEPVIGPLMDRWSA